MIPLLKSFLNVDSNIGTLEQRTELIQAIYNLKENTPTTDFSNDNCWRSSNLNLPDWLQMSVDKQIKECYSQYKEDDVFSYSNRETYSYKHWVNVNAPGSRNVMHRHASAHLSCVYYLQGKDTGSLRICNPANILGDCNFSAPWVRDFAFTPNDGDLIMWPAWMPHEVETNLSSLDRVNIVFDIEFDKK